MLHAPESQSTPTLHSSLARLSIVTLEDAGAQLLRKLNTARNQHRDGTFPVKVHKTGGTLCCFQSDIDQYLISLKNEQTDPVLPPQAVAQPLSAVVKRGRGRPRKITSFAPQTNKAGV